MRLNFFYTLVSTALLHAALNVPPCVAADSWTELKQQGAEAELRDNYALAATSFADAIKQVPPKDLNLRAELNARLGSMFLHLRRFADADRCVDILALLISQLKASDKTDPEMLTHVAFLADGYEHAMKMTKRGTIAPEKAQSFCEQAMRLRALCTNEQPVLVQHEMKLARYYVDLHQEENAERAVADALGKTQPKSEIYDSTRLDLAALQFKKGKPALMEQLTKTMSSKYSALTVLERTAAAHIWADNQAQAVKELEQADGILHSHGDKDVDQKLKITQMFADNFIDKEDWPCAEPYLRDCVDLQRRKDDKSEPYFRALDAYANALKKQGKIAQAEAAKKTAPKDHQQLEWLLDEKDQQLLREQRNKPGSKTDNH